MMKTVLNTTSMQVVEGGKVLLCVERVRRVRGNFYNLNIRWSFFSFSWSILLNVTNLDYMEVGVDIKQRNKGHPKLTESNMKIYTSVVYILLVVQMYLSGPITYNQRNPFYNSKNHRP